MTAWDPDFAGTFVWRHNVIRYVAPFDHAKPVWFHLPGLLLGMLPWTLLLPGLVRWLSRHSARTAARRPPALGFFLLSFGWTVLFYSLAGCKRAVYILPALPPLALALGCYLDAVLPWERARDLLARRAHHRLPAGRLALGATALVVAAAWGGCLVAAGSGLLRPANGLLLAGTVAGAGGLLLRYGSGQGGTRRWALCGAATFAVLLGALHLVLPPYARRFSLRGHLRPQAALCADPEVPVVCYPRGWDSVGFYLRRSDVRVFTPGQSDELVALLGSRSNGVLVVKSDGPLDEVLRALPAALEFVPHGRPGPVTVGQVRPRPVAPDAVLARRSAGADAR